MKKVFTLILTLIFTISLCPFDILANAGSDDSLILYYSFENGATATVGENAISYNVSFTDKDSVAGSAVYLDGETSYLQLPSELNKSLSSDFTISTWVKFDTLKYWMRIFDFGENDQSYAFLGLSAPNDLRYALLTDKSGYEYNTTATGTIFENKWTHITLVREDTYTKLYINGALTSSTNAFGTNNPADIDNSKNYIGKSQFELDPYFHGHIDEFKVFNRALSYNEITRNMSEGINSNFASLLTLSSKIKDGMTVRENLNLVSFTGENSSLYWTSSNEKVISNLGIVSRDETEHTVTLTAKVTLEGEEQEFLYNLFVPAKSTVDAEIYVNTNEKGVDINPDMIGLFFEDINYAADGGLYAELVQNRSFEAVDAQYSVTNPLPIPHHAWTINGKHTFLGDNPLNQNNMTFLRFISPDRLTSFSNACYDGFPVSAGDKLDFSAFIRTEESYPGQIMITLTEGDRIIGRSFLSGFSPEWTKYETEITAVANADNAVLKITLLDSSNGNIDFDMVSLFPQNTWMNRKNGLRADLVQMLKDLHPGFLRFPGGCIIEGYNLANRYSWKDTIGPVEERKENWNRWQKHTSGNGRYGYCQTYGLGFYEYFLLCEDIGAFPLPVVNVGIGCQFQSSEVSSMEELYSIYIQDALDLIEFANGDPAESSWAAVRASMGHPEPFNLEYIGIGNEQKETATVNFFERYEAFEREIHKYYPDIKLIATAGPSNSGPEFDAAWTFLKAHFQNGEENFAYAVDEHYYCTPDWFYTNLDRYDDYDRSGYKVFPGEYASRYSQVQSESNLNSALSIAAYMTSLEKNADIVQLASYAPLFAREGYSQWYPDLIGFDSKTVYGAPDYYVQSMYSNNMGSYTIENKTVNSNAPYIPRGRCGISTWSTAASFYDMKITDNITGEEIPLGNPVSTGSGSWYKSEYGYTQESSTALAPALLFGTETMQDYTFTLKAKKHSGAEGFLIPVLWTDENNYFTCNIGGWGNAYSAIQRTENGNTIEYSVQNTTTHIETNREYEIKVIVKPHKLSVYLDGELVNFVSFRQEIYSTASFDKETGDIIIKIVNTTHNVKEAAITIDADNIYPIADITCLSKENSYEVNSIINPQNIAPFYSTLLVSDSFSAFLPANSFTVMRIHTNDNCITQIQDAEITLDKGDKLLLPDTVTVTHLDGSISKKEVTWDNLPQEITRAAGNITLEGKIDGSNLYAHANITINETGNAIILEPSIEYNGKDASFSLNFTKGNADFLNVIAVIAAYNEDGILTKVNTVSLSPERTEYSVDITDFLSEYSVKLLMLNNANYIMDAVIVK